MILPITNKVLSMNTRENEINNIVKHDCITQKILFILTAKYNIELRNNNDKKIELTYKFITDNLGVELKRNRIKQHLKNLNLDNSIELTFDNKNIVINYVRLPKESETHLIDLDKIMKCKSVNQIKAFIILSSGNKFIYRNLIASLIGLNISNVSERKNATMSIKRLFDSMKKNEILDNFSYDADNKKFNVKVKEAKKIVVKEIKKTESMSVVKTTEKKLIDIYDEDKKTNENNTHKVNLVYLNHIKK